MLIRSGKSIEDTRRCIEISRSLLPLSRAEAITRTAREVTSIQALSFARDSFVKSEFRAALRYVWAGLRCSSSPRIMKALLLLLLRGAQAGLRRPIQVAQRAYGRARA
jgi:hypothetical protein